MKRLLYLILFFLPVLANGQLTQLALTKLGNWNGRNPTRNIQQHYSDVWGWAAPDGREYAIFGALDSIYFIEVTDPANPIVRAKKAGRYNNNAHREFKT